MEIASKIIRRSIFIFLKYFQYFTTIPVLVLLPFSVSVLLSQALFRSSGFSSLLLIIHASRFSSLSEFMSFLNENLSDQTMVMYLIGLPFAVSSLLIAKACVIQALDHHKPSLSAPFCSSISLYWPLVLTHLCSLVLFIIINMVTFLIVFFALNYVKQSVIFLAVVSVVFYGLLANMVVISNLALVVAVKGSCRGYAAIYKACMLRKGRNSMAFLLALPANLGLAAIEALFQYRLVRVYHSHGRFSACIALEGMLIAYLYSLLVVLDTIACCLFYKSCESSALPNQSDRSYDGFVLLPAKESLEVLP